MLAPWGGRWSWSAFCRRRTAPTCRPRGAIRNRAPISCRRFLPRDRAGAGAGKFHLAFFDDRLAMPDRYGNDHAHAVEHGIRCVKMDPIVVLMAMGMATERLGLGATCSTTYYEPFHVARLFATLDLMTDGRAAWNVVTSLNDGEALNMGRDEVIEHDLRYDRADEFMEVVLGHWDTWDDDALIVDKASGRFADADQGAAARPRRRSIFSSRGPFTVPRSPQGHPVVIQAGPERPRPALRGRWGELIFVAIAERRDRQARLCGAQGRSRARPGAIPTACAICNLVYPCRAATKAEAEDKLALIEQLPLDIDALSLLSEALNFDFATKGLDEPLTHRRAGQFLGPAEHPRSGADASAARRTRRCATSWTSATADGRTMRSSAARRRSPTRWRSCSPSGRAMASSSRRPTCRAATPTLSQYVVPELQRRGLYHTEYTGETLRENLGLPRPEVGAWRFQEARFRPGRARR